MMILVCALSLSIGWGIRGNFGHEYGAMIPGALAALAAAIFSGREDWWKRSVYFALFGALGWSFGGSISYMWVIGYTHSGHAPSQLYGYACLFLIGFLWGALGGAGTALPACLDRDRLTALFPPMIAVFLAWTLEDGFLGYVDRGLSSRFRHLSPHYWYDTDWIAAYLALIAVLLLAAVRRRICFGTSLVIHLAIGWILGFSLVVGMVDGLPLIGLPSIEFRMTPPRGDNWAGILGMTAGAIIFFCRQGLRPVLYALLVTGFFGGIGFTGATFLKLAEVRYVPALLSDWFGPGSWQTNWHSILEQSYGFINGIGVGAAMCYLARRLPILSDQPRNRTWTEVFSAAFVLVGITYVNMVKNVPNWVEMKAIPATLYGIPTRIWFDGAYALLAIALLLLLCRHVRRPIGLVPQSGLGKVQLLYITFLWWMVVGNLMRAIPPFNEQRLITEGVIHVNAVICTLLVLSWPGVLPSPDRPDSRFGGLTFGLTLSAGLLAFVAVVGLSFWGARAMFGDTFAGHAGYHVRFGPDAPTGKPEEGKPHP
jgi:hypothetical protein